MFGVYPCLYNSSCFTKNGDGVFTSYHQQSRWKNIGWGYVTAWGWLNSDIFEKRSAEILCCSNIEWCKVENHRKLFKDIRIVCQASFSCTYIYIYICKYINTHDFICVCVYKAIYIYKVIYIYRYAWNVWHIWNRIRDT